MSAAQPGSRGQVQPIALRRAPTTISNESGVAYFETDESHGENQDDHILVQFNGHFNGAFMLPNTTFGKKQGENDAQIAARRAMSKRNSRSYTARISRQRSRRREILGQPAKPGITVDTSFTRHKGNVPHQVYPYDKEMKGSGSIRKDPWFGLGRLSTKNKGLGIMRGTPQPGNHSADQTPPLRGASRDPKTADSISPWDRPIPIGLSVPSDSLPSYSPYQSTRQRSASDATLATPSIIITPAEAFKSVWSPDTASDYTPGRASSIYSRAALFNMDSANSDVPPVPALPADVLKASNGNSTSNHYRGTDGVHPSHTRNGTLDSAGTAFEEEDDFVARNRIASTATVFEEDEVPLRGQKTQSSTLSLDTSMVPTPRRSQGWWNVITTPFVMSRSNSVWTQNPGSSEKAPNVPVMPSHFGAGRDTPSTASTYIWSATEKGSPDHGGYPMLPGPLSVDAIKSQVSEYPEHSGAIGGFGAKLPQVVGTPDRTNSLKGSIASNSISTKNYETEKSISQTPPIDRNMASPLSTMSASPVVGTAAMGTVLMPRQVNDHSRSADVAIELQERRVKDASVAPAQPIHDSLPVNPISQPSVLLFQASPPANTMPQPTVQLFQTSLVANTISQANGQPFNASAPVNGSSRSSMPPVNASSPPRFVNVNLSTQDDKAEQQSLPVFAPPPTYAQKGSRFSYEYGSRPSTPSTSPDLKQSKLQKKHRKVGDMLSWLPFGRRNQKSKKQDKKKKNRGLCFWCCGCCILLLVLLAIIIPVVVVASRKQNDTPNGQQPPAQESATQWLNLTGYPPIPTGLSTIAQPEAVEEESGCVTPATIWSCALPKELHQSVSPNKPDQPNFQLEITFENGTVADPTKTQPVKRAANPVSAGAFIRSRFFLARAVPSASPVPPRVEDMQFLGNTTDDIKAPFEGEDTPFFIGFQDPAESTAARSRLMRRDDPDDPTNITSIIPPPQLNTDGTAAPASLYPFPSGQPLRLYNRGRVDEHYGFYTYFDRSIFLKDIKSSTGRGGNPADSDGGSPFDAATMRCTFSQSRFLVQIWTRSETTKPLLQSSAQNSSGARFKRPGSFPYPVTITLDRHGGDVSKKNLYCYQMEKDGTISNEASKRFFQFEDRAFGGNLVNPTQGRPNVTGSIDGGTGGCRCQWQNWLG